MLGYLVCFNSVVMTLFFGYRWVCVLCSLLYWGLLDVSSWLLLICCLFSGWVYRLLVIICECLIWFAAGVCVCV